MTIGPSISSRFEKSSVTGLVFAIVGALLFSFKPVLIKLIYQQQVDTVTILAYRMLFSLPFYLVVGIWVIHRKRATLSIRARAIFQAIGLGIVGYYGAAYADLYGLQFISTQLGRMILFTYPTLVTLFGWWLLDYPIRKGTFRALLISYVGIALIFSHDLQLYGSDVMQGAGWVFCSAVAFSFFLVFSKALIGGLGSKLFTCIAMSSAAVMVLLHYALRGFGEMPNTQGLSLILILAVFSTVLPSFFVSAAISRIGSSRTAIAACLGPVMTSILAVWLLDEIFSFNHFIGLALVVIAVASISISRDEPVGKGG
ncbi:MAG: EamA family transporter [Gammaproteobacteria bacterium]|nr:EamA family transporter [Gammaproteobacteria bacterium]